MTREELAALNNVLQYWQNYFDQERRADIEEQKYQDEKEYRKKKDEREEDRYKRDEERWAKTYGLDLKRMQQQEENDTYTKNRNRIKDREEFRKNYIIANKGSYPIKEYTEGEVEGLYGDNELINAPGGLEFNPEQQSMYYRPDMAYYDEKRLAEEKLRLDRINASRGTAYDRRAIEQEKQEAVNEYLTRIINQSSKGFMGDDYEELLNLGSEQDENWMSKYAPNEKSLNEIEIDFTPSVGIIPTNHFKAPYGFRDSATIVEEGNRRRKIIDEAKNKASELWHEQKQVNTTRAINKVKTFNNILAGYNVLSELQLNPPKGMPRQEIDKQYKEYTLLLAQALPGLHKYTQLFDNVDQQGQPHHLYNPILENNKSLKANLWDIKKIVNGIVNRNKMTIQGIKDENLKSQILATNLQLKQRQLSEPPKKR